MTGPRFDWATLIANKDKEIARLEGVYRSNLEKAGVEIVDSRAVIEDAHTSPHPQDERGHPRPLHSRGRGRAPGPRTADPGRRTRHHVERGVPPRDLPERILVVGAGYIAVEFAGIFNGLGSDVTLLHRGDRLLRGFDEDVREALGEAYAMRGIELALGRTVDRLDRTSDGIAATLSDGSARIVDQVLVATGRRPNTARLGLENAGVVTDAVGAIMVDAYSQTLIPSIYAVGDVTNRAALTPVAIREGHAFADTVFGGRPTMVDHSIIPTAVFSTPEIGVVGCTRGDGAGALRRIDVYKTSFRPMRATLSGGSDRVLMKLLVDKASDKVVGVHIVGHDAGEMIQAIGIAVTMGATKADFDRTIAVHPTAAEELVTMRTPFVVKKPVAVG